MNLILKKNKDSTFKMLGMAIFVVVVFFVWQGRKGFNLWDEGFLWYGVQRVMQGEVPIRDYMAYDPGRYYWSAIWMNVLGGNGIMNLRAAVAIFQALGLFVGLLLISQSTHSKEKNNYLFLIIAATTLMTWMFPRHKLFDISLSIFLIGILTYLVQKPIPKRYIISGVCIGLIAVFGRNHGMYGAVGNLGAMLWLSIKRTSELNFFKGLWLWSIGVVTGFMPIILMMLAIPGFTLAFWESILFLFEQKATNLPLPVPWPWTVGFSALSVGDTIRGVLVGLFFIGTLAFGALGLLWVVIRRKKDKPVSPPLVASVFLALPYAHYAFSRADVGHLAQGIFPLLIGCLVILSTAGVKVKWPLAIALFSASFWVMHVFHPGWQCRNNIQCENVIISGYTIQVDSRTAKDIELLREIAEQYAPNDQGFIATPFWPGAYALLKRRSPMWEIFALFPRTQTFEKKEIERIKSSNPGFAFVFDYALDGREELRFRNTHPLIYKYILDSFDPLPSTLNPDYQIYIARTLVE